MELSNLRPAEGSKHSDNFRRGRGHGSGNGKTAGKGHKGQLARSGHKKPGFEGGQMPLYRRLPKRGFTNRNSKEIIAINVDVLNRFEDGAEVTVDSLLASGKVVTDSAMQFRKEGVNMGLPTFSEYEIWRTDIENVRAAKKVLEEL